MRQIRNLSLTLGICAILVASVASVAAQRVALVSINRTGAGSGNMQSRFQKISANGRYVVFESDASDLVPLDNNGFQDVFRYDLVTGRTQLVSVTPSGTSGNGPSFNPVITASGQYVIFSSDASDLLSGPPGGPSDTNGKPDVFRRFFPLTGDVVCIPLCTSLVSVNRMGTDSGATFFGGSVSPTVSADGAKIAFISDSFDLVTGTVPTGFNVYLREYEEAGTTTRLITVPVGGPFACPRDSYNPVLSTNGRYIAFESLANDLTMEVDPCNGSASDRDIFVYDRVGNSIRLASKARTNTAAGNGVSRRPVIANDGAVAFSSVASDLVLNDNNNQPDVFVSRPSAVTLVSINMAGTGSGNGPCSEFVSISADGRRVAFDSNATDLVAISDLNSTADVFMRDLTLNTTSLVSINRLGNGAGNRQSTRPAISANGRTVAFESEASDLVGGLIIGFTHDIFVRELPVSRTKRLNTNINNNGGGNFPSYDSEISANGNVVSFISNATNLVTLPDANQELEDVFAVRQGRQTTDYDGDGRTDIAVWRPSNGTWYVQQSSNNSLSAASFGLSSDIPSPADYDGDGRTDVAVFRPSTGFWYISQSTDGALRAFQFGMTGDIPVAGDYDGDGRADIAVWRPGSGVWYILNIATNAFSAQAWGSTGDKPVPIDYDGDGRTDIAVFRPSNGIWYIINSANSSFRSVPFGLSTDKPVAGDYDADGRADIAVWRPSNGVWYALTSSNSLLLSTPWGTSGDRPQPGDFDGDGRNDFAVWRSGNATWYVLQSSNNGVLASPFGLSSDVPVSSPYIIE